MAEESKVFQVVYDYSDAPTLKKFTLDNSRVRMVMGPFGCLRGDQLIVTEEGLLPISRLTPPVRVLSWNEKSSQFQFSLSGGAFPKGKDYLYRISTPRGEFVAAGHHRVLLSDHMYRQVSDLCREDVLLQCSSSHLQRYAFENQKSSHEDDLHSFGKSEDCLDRYVKLIRLYGQRLHWGVNFYPIFVPSQGGAQGLSKYFYSDVFLRSDDFQELLPEHTLPYQSFVQIHTGGYPSQVALHNEVEVNYIFLQFFQRTFFLLPQFLLSLYKTLYHHIKKLFLEYFHSLKSSSLSDGAILSIERLDVKEYFWDMQVDETHNYITADGTIHHNSGKSSACVFDIVRRANEQTPSPDGIRRSRWAVVRNSYGQLKDTTIKTFHDWFPPRLFGEYRVTDHSYLITKFPGVHLEVLFRALDRPDQVSNLLSLELTGAWFNEVREIPSAIITAMDGRINRYPSMRDGGPSWTGMIMDTNPPSDDSWLYKQFEVIRPDNWKIFKQPSGLSVHAENTKHLPKNYYINLAKGKDEMYKRIYIDGQYGYLVSGKPVFQSFRDNIHVAPHQLEPQKGLDVLVGFDFGLCYDDQTEVLTKAGWKFFKDVTDKDLVMTKNFETNVIEYQKPSKRIVREHDGDMYLYENNNLNFCVTAEHIVPCRKKCGRNGVDFKGNYRLTAEYLFNETSTNYSIDLLSKWNGNSRGLFGPLKWKANIFANFMGLYLSEGSCDRVHNRISIAQNKQDTLFQGILDDTGLDWKRGKKAWRCSNEKLNDYLKQFGYSSEKYIPDIIKNMASSDIERFIMTYTNGDGHIRLRENGSIEHTIFTISKRMADDFQELAQKVGWYAKIRIVKSQKSVIFENGKGREIHNEGGYSITFKKRAKQSRMIKKYFSKIKYYGKVYCLTVPNGTLYIRRKLTPSWNGNSPSVIIAQITPLGQLRILDELVSDGMGLRQFCENQLLPLLRLKYFGMNVMGFGDPSGTSRAPTDESTCFEVLQGPEVGLRNVVPAPTNAILPRVAAVENFLNRMYAGEPSFILSPNCHYLRKAMNGGYHYEKDPRSLGEEYKIMPAKNFSSHISDALEYLCMFIAEKDTHDKKWKELSSRVNLIGHTPVNSLGGY